MAAGGCPDLADRFHADVDSRVIAQGHFRIGQVIVYGAGYADTGYSQVAQGLCSPEASVSADHNKAVDLHAFQRFYSFFLVFLFLEFQASRRTKISTRIIRDIEYQFQRKLLHVILQVGAFPEQTVISALDADQRNAVHRGASCNRHHRRVHSRAVTAAG